MASSRATARLRPSLSRASRHPARRAPVSAFAAGAALPAAATALAAGGVVPTYATAALIFGALPALDAAVGAEAPGTGAATPKASSYRLAARALVPLNLFALLAAAAAVPELPLPDLLGLGVSAGVTAGVGINAAHELLHACGPDGERRTRDEWIDGVLAQTLLGAVAYGFWQDAHLAHHRDLALDGVDTAAARRGEPLPAFWARSAAGCLSAAFAHHGARGTLAAAALTWTALPAGFAAACWYLGGAPGLALFATQAAVGVLLLETVNYIEHYGLVRKPGDHVGTAHSWNYDSLLTNLVLLRLQRHSDHHVHARRPYPALRSRGAPEAPQLPACYPACMLLALVPNAWFAVMDPLIPPSTAPAGATTNSTTG